jgi:hypothetical protein
MKVVTCVVLVLFSLLPARAWNSLGHQAVAELAWRQMSPAERQAASDLLRQHPLYHEMLLEGLPAGVDTNEWAFLNAAVWLDRVRPAKPGQAPKPESITKFDIYPHAIGYPFLRTGETNRALLDKFVIAKPDAEMVLSNAITTLNNPKAAAQERAVSLCVVLHLCGDLHQPLHAANQVSKKHSKGAGLGGAALVRDERGNELGLHTFWDYLPGQDLSYKSVVHLADELACTPGLNSSALKEYQADKTIASWVQESFRVAVTFAYAEDHVRFADAADVKSGKVAAADLPKLSDDYVREAHQIARRRLALAAYRLTDELKRVW